MKYQALRPHFFSVGGWLEGSRGGWVGGCWCWWWWSGWQGGWCVLGSVLVRGG